MILVNGKKIKYFNLDDFNSIRRRIAVQNKSLSKYIVIDNFDELKDGIKLTYSNFLEEVQKDNENENISFDTFYTDEIKEKYNEIPIQEIIKVWLMNNKTVRSKDIYILAVQGEIDSRLGENKVEVSRFLRNELQDYKTKVNNEIATLKKQEEKWILFSEEYDNLEEVPYTKFEPQKITFEMTTNIKNKELYDIFDDIIPSEVCPFSTINNYFKIYSKFIPLKSWNLSIETLLILRICGNKEVNIQDSYKDTEYNEVFIYKEGEQIKIRVKMNEETEIEVEEIKNRIFSIFSTLKFEITEEKQIEISGLFYIPHFDLNKYVFSDLVMNNNIYNTFLNINESLKASKLKSGVYVYFIDDKKGELITASIIDKISERSDIEMKNKSKLLFPYNEAYIRVRISRAKNISSIENFQLIFSKLLSLYNKEYDKIVNYYREFLPNFGEKIKIQKNEEDKQLLKDIVPELFISGYSKKCLNKPTIINQEEVEDYEEKGYDIMHFPKSEEEGEQHYYVCDTNERFPFPGVRLNTLENSKQYPYIPCCFEKDQKTKKSSGYKEYFLEEKNVVQKDQQRIIITNKFADFNQFADLPKNLGKFFESIDSTKTYFRKGVSKSQSNFLECVLEGIEDKNIFSIKENKRIEYLNKFRETGGKKYHFESALQSQYDKKVNEIKEIFKNSDVYLDPLEWCGFFEEIFNCNIYLFLRKHAEYNAELILPRHTNGYYRFEPKKISILIYIHSGSDLKPSKFPQCELIIGWKKDLDIVQYKFDEKDDVSIECNKIFQKIRKAYSGEKKIVDTIFPKEIKEGIESQIVDECGKCRGFLYQGVMCLTDPIPPFNIKLIDLNEVVINNNKGDVSAFKKKYVISGKIGNTNINFDLNISNHSELRSFKKEKKNAKNLNEYFIYLYSKFLKDNEDEISLESIAKFVNKNCIINENFVYGTVGREIKLYEKNLFQNKKLVVKGSDLLKKLVYSLRLTIDRNRNKVLTYYTKNNMDNYYEGITSFKIYPISVNVFGKESIERWIYEKNGDTLLYERVMIDKKTPYFFKNNQLSEFVYIAQNYSEINTKLNGIYIYKNYKDIKPLGDVGNKDRINLIYKFGGKIMYTSLVKLN